MAIGPNRGNRWHISLDHQTPGDESTQVVAALWVNRLKSFLTEAQFRAVIHELTSHIRTGAPFNKDVLDGVRFGQTVRKLGAGNPLVTRRL